MLGGISALNYVLTLDVYFFFFFVCVVVVVFLFFFFFQAEDGIRDVAVTGVQTCALPICCVGCTLNCSTREVLT